MSGVAALAYSKSGCLAEQDGDLTGCGALARAGPGGAGRAPGWWLLPTNPTLAAVVEGIAALTAARGEHARAAELLGLAHALQGFHNPGSLETGPGGRRPPRGPRPGRVRRRLRPRPRLGRADALALTP